MSNFQGLFGGDIYGDVCVIEDGKAVTKDYTAEMILKNNQNRVKRITVMADGMDPY